MGMYGVVGTDGVVYGPVPLGNLFEWIAQGRIVPNTILIDWQGRQIPASLVPELQGAFPVQTAPYPFAVPMTPFGGKKKSTALWLAFLLGFLGAHRFYLGHTWTGLAMLLLNVAALGFTSDIAMAVFLVVVATVWLIADMARIASGSLREANGRALA